MDYGVFDDLSDDYEEVASMVFENGNWKVASDDSAEIVSSLEEAVDKFNELVKDKASN